MILSRLLRSSIKAIGIVDSASEPEPWQYEDALESLNSMLRLWTVRKLVVFHIVTEQFTITAGDSSFTIGTGGDFNTDRPSRLVGGFIRDSTGTDSPLKVISREQYNRIAVKTEVGRPEELYYYPSFPLGTIKTDCVADQEYSLSLDSLKPLDELATLNDEINLPPEYEEALKWNLAIRLAPDYNVEPRKDVVEFARTSYNALSTQPVPEAEFPGVPGARRERFNINTGY